MSRFWKAFHKGRIARLTDEELDSISRGLTPLSLLPSHSHMAYGKAKGPSWASGRSRWIVPERGVTGMMTGRARRVVKFGYARPFRVGRNRTGGYYGRFKSAGGEKKFFDQDIDDSTIAIGATIFQNASAEQSLLRIAQGTTESTRIGRKLVIRNIHWTMTVSLKSSTATGGGDVVRIILYLDKQTNGQTATSTGILETATFQSYRNLANTSRFSILYDKTLALSHTAGAGDALDFGENKRVLKFNKQCNIPIEYDNSFTTGALSTIRSNNINMLILSSAGRCDLISKMRLRFTD